MQTFHTSCSIKKTKKCCDKQFYLEENKTLPADETQSDILNGELIKKPVAWENQILKEMNSDLRANIQLLKEKITHLEMENFNLKEVINKKQEQTPTAQESIIKQITETIKSELDNSLKLVKAEINNLNQKINKLDINLKSTTKKSNNNLSTTDKKQLTSTVEDKIPVTPKQYSQQLITGLPKQNILQSLEQHQQKVMNEIIHIDSDKPLTQENILNNNAKNETEKWQVVHGKKKSFKKNVGQSEENSEKFTGVKPKVWLYLYRITPDVTEDDIKQYIKIKTNNKNEEFIVKDLKEPGSNRFKTFMVAGDFRYKETFYDPSFWPKGVFFRRFDFKKHFEKHKTRHVIENENDARSNSFLEVLS